MWWIYGFSMAHPQQKWKLLMGTSSIIRGNCSLPWLSTSKVSIYILLCGTFGSPRCPRCGVLWGLSNFSTNAWGLHTSERKKGHEGAIPPFQATTWWGLFTLIFLCAFIWTNTDAWSIAFWKLLSSLAQQYVRLMVLQSRDVRFQICCWKVAEFLSSSGQELKKSKSKKDPRALGGIQNPAGWSMARFWTMIPIYVTLKILFWGLKPPSRCKKVVSIGLWNIWMTCKNYSHALDCRKCLSDSILDHRGLPAPTDSEEFELSNRRGCSHDFEIFWIYAEVNMCKFNSVQEFLQGSIVP